MREWVFFYKAALGRRGDKLSRIIRRPDIFEVRWKDPKTGKFIFPTKEEALSLTGNQSRP